MGALLLPTCKGPRTGDGQRLLEHGGSRAIFCVIAVFVNEIDIIWTCSLGIQVFFRPREMGRESGWGGGCFFALFTLPWVGHQFSQSRTQFPPAQLPVFQFSKFGGYWKPQEIRLETPDSPDPHLGPTVSNISRWQNEQV